MLYRVTHNDSAVFWDMIQNLKKEKDFLLVIWPEIHCFPTSRHFFLHDNFYLMIGLIKYAEVSYNAKQYQALLKNIYKLFSRLFRKWFSNSNTDMSM